MTEPAWKRRFRAPRMTFPLWARDRAEHLAYASNASGKFEVYVWDERAGRHRQATDRPEGTGTRVTPELDPSGERLWWWDDTKGDEFGRWVTEPFAGGPRVSVAPELALSYAAGLALARDFAIVGRSTDEGASVHLVRDGASACQLYAHREAASVCELSRDERLVAIEHSEHGDARNSALRVLDTSGRAVAELWDGPGRGLSARWWSPVPADERVIVFHERDGIERPLLWRVDTNEEQRVEVDLPGEVRAEWYPDGRALLLIHDHRGRAELWRYELERGSLSRVETPPGNIAVARVRPDGALWYAGSTSAEPPAIRDTSGRVVARPPGDVAPSGVPYRDLQVGAVHGFLALPPSGARPLPTIVLVHGGPEAHDRDSFSPTVQAWVDHGFAVACVNYRGSSGYGKAWRDAITGRPGLTELEDIAAVADHLVASGIADARRLVLAGGSWGGYLTLLGLGTQPRRWSLGLASVPIGDYVAAFEDEMEPLKRYDAALFGGTPAEVPEVYRERSPITYADRVVAPTMLLVGHNDPRCPARSAELYIRRLEERGATHEVYRYDAGHGSARVEEQIGQVAAQLAFAARHLGTTPPIA